MAEPPSSPPSAGSSAEDALTWYKSQYEMLESELAEFRESSRELEQELEKDIERAEKQERLLQERAEALNFEVEEWKRKYKESKSEASAAQATLEKEITTLRESGRSLALKLRDSEVANDDFERQARNTTSSLEDMESKCNQAIERNVMMEEEIRIGEQEREKLRIEAQRLREEMSELKIEAEVMQDKLKKFDAARHLSTISSDLSLVDSPTFDRALNASPDSITSSPLITTPPETKSLGEPTTQLLDPPPSPPMSDASAPVPRPTAIKTPGPVSGNALRRSRLPSVDTNLTPRPRGIKPPTASARVPTSGRSSATGGASLRASTNRPPPASRSGHRLPASNSLSHIRLLTAQMQRLEARVQSVRSKLPAAAHTPPRVSPRATPPGPNPSVPSSITVRSRKRTTGSTASSSATGDETTPTSQYTSTSRSSHMPRLSTSGVSRLSFGETSNRGPESEMSRPSSRASISSYARPASRTDMIPPPRPMTRSSISSARTPIARPQSSLGGSLHSHSASLSRMDLEEEYGDEYRTPSRRGTYSSMDFRGSVSSIPMPGSGIPTPGVRRQSGVRRTSTSGITHSGRVSTTGFRKLGDLGETY
ncbi:Nuclear distributionnudE-like protein [Cladobotryum mycophilum]|uniref:Nuclear distributionnudE-like protein n=1 Tax=Cladobotryum mycophilum TaxID=491253 RepID=A0ABR0SC07_9HYPO